MKVTATLHAFHSSPQGLLVAFSKLLEAAGKTQHTYVESDTVRCVFEPALTPRPHKLRSPQPPTGGLLRSSGNSNPNLFHT